MNHFKISIIKSILRILGSIASILIVTLMQSLFGVGLSCLTFSSLYGIAEILGILEEVFDKRKEK